MLNCVLKKKYNTHTHIYIYIHTCVGRRRPTKIHYCQVVKTMVITPEPHAALNLIKNPHVSRYLCMIYMCHKYVIYTYDVYIIL
jgi:hypothetical protein